MALHKSKGKGKFLKIADGKLRLPSYEGDPEAELRKGTTGDGSEYELWEQVFEAVDGRIVSIYKHDHDDFGTSYNISIQDEDGDIYILPLQEDSRYFQTFASIIPNVDLEEPVTIRPYSMPIDGKSYRSVGLSLYQRSEDEVDEDGELKWIKVDNYYKQYNETTGKSKLVNGMEAFDFSKTKKKSERKKLNIDMVEFLVEELEEIIEAVKDLNPKVKEPKQKDEKKPSGKKASTKKKTTKKKGKK